MRDRSEEFRCVAFLLERIGGVSASDQTKALRAHFPFLPGRRGGDQAAFDHSRRAGGEFRQMLGTWGARIDDYLQVRQA